MRCAAFDIGDRWIGIAIADTLGIVARPYNTVNPEGLDSAISKLIEQESVTTFVVGYPKTMSGTESEQTKRVVATFNDLAKRYETHNGIKITWALWDERLSSKRAQEAQRGSKKKEKHSEHAVAASFILQSYLDNKAFFKASSMDNH